MKRIRLLITLLLFPLCASAFELVTEKGKVYEDCTIAAVLPHGVRIRSGKEDQTSESMLFFHWLADESLSELLEQIKSPAAKETITAIQQFRKQRAELVFAYEEKIRQLNAKRAEADSLFKSRKITGKQRGAIRSALKDREKQIRAEFKRKNGLLTASVKTKIASAEKAAAEAERKSAKENAADQEK